MKLTTIFFGLLFSLSSYAIDPTPGTGTYDPGVSCPHGCNDGSQSRSFPEQYIQAQSLSLGDYITDSCEERINVYYGHGTCKDGSVSFIQPPSEGRWKQEGMCGQVGISNLYNNYCNWNIKVEDVDEHYAWDNTPGTRTGVLVDGVNKVFSTNSDCPSGRFSSFNAKDEKDYIASVLSATHQTVGDNQLVRINNRGQKVKRAPVMALIAMPNEKVLHWVMVVDVEFHDGQCQFIVNSWDDQMTVPCTVMAKWSRDVDTKFSLIPGNHKYTIIEFKKN